MLKTQKVATIDLRIGMFVSGLDRPWLETPFITQGFVIETADQITQLQQYCKYVHVDFRRSQKIGFQKRQALQKLNTQRAVQKRKVDRPRVPLDDIFQGRKLRQYHDHSLWEEESPRAQRALSTLILDIADLFETVSSGDKLNFIRLKKSIEPVVDSISRNPDACLWVSRLKQHDHYTYQHSLSASMWAVSLGRQVGLPRQDLRSLAMGCLLMDVGKLRVDPTLLQAERELTQSEVDEVASHINHGLQILEECGVINNDVIDMVAYHHERYDGSGYPNALRRDSIPVFARIAGIVDTYDALISDRQYARAIAPSDAIKLLYHSRDRDFQAELVEAFIQAVGIYPAGTLVELSSGEVGVVVAEYRTRRLHPKVLLLLDANKKRIVQPHVIDLHEVSGGAAVHHIAKSLEPQAYGIDLAQVAEVAQSVF